MVTIVHTGPSLKVHDFSHLCALLQDARHRGQGQPKRSFFIPTAPRQRCWKTIVLRDDGKLEVRHEDQELTEVVTADDFLSGDWGEFLRAGRLWTFSY